MVDPKDSFQHEPQDRLNEIKAVEDELLKIWASADDEGDTQRMRELFTNIKSKELEEICKLICRRLSEGTSEAQRNLAASTSKAQLNFAYSIVPEYLWIDPPGFVSEMEKRRTELRTHECELVVIKWMGGQFVCKSVWGSDAEGFMNEAVVQASLWHANVMHLLWCTRGFGGRSLVMELMDEDLGQVIKRRRRAGMDPPFSLLAGIDIMLQIAKGMEYLHDRGIMHRDLKSFNILVRRSQHADNRDQLLSVKVADFGASKVKHNTSLFTTKRVGTSIWRAPEVLNDEDETRYTNKADVYSFAIVCSEILTGLSPAKLLPCGRMSELLKVLKEGRRPELPYSCPAAIANYIKRCWDEDALKRPTFKHTCKVFRVFKACLLSGRTELLASSLPHMFNELPDFQTAEVERGFQGRLYHPVLGMLKEMDCTVEMAQSRFEGGH